MPVQHTISPLALENCAVFFVVLAFAVEQVVMPLTFVLRAVRPVALAMTFSTAAFERTYCVVSQS